jgi:hypothetical protein
MSIISCEDLNWIELAQGSPFARLCGGSDRLSGAE